MNALATKIIALFLSIISAFSSFAVSFCSVYVKEGITAESTVLEYTVKNGSFMKLCCDEYYTLEKEGEDGRVKLDINYDVNDIEIILLPMQSYTHSIDIIKDFGHTLDAGYYILTVNIGGKNVSTVFTVEG